MPKNKAVIPAEAVFKFRKIFNSYVQQEQWKRYFTELPNKKSKGHYGEIEKPMNLAEVRVKLRKGLYKDPVAMLDDIWQAFTNALIYFKGSGEKTMEFRTALTADLTPVFEELGYCCGDNRDLPENLQRPMCHICEKRVAWGAHYHEASSFAHKVDFDPVLCNACFTNAKREVTVVRMQQADREKDALIPVDRFERHRCNQLKQEQRTPCGGCGRRVHATCLGYTPFHKGTLRCSQCGPTPNAPNTLSENLPTCALSQYIETKVNQFTAAVELQAGVERPQAILVRVLASLPQETGFAPLMRDRYQLKSMDCVLRSVFVFEKLADGKEVCFFAFRVLEFDDTCSYEPNRRCVYLQYVDSVKVFDPDVLRTKVYQRILLAYFAFARHSGFQRIYIWSCPPQKNGPTYIFPSRPVDQMLPNKKRLFDWYVKLLETGKELGIVSAYAQLKDQIKKDGAKSLNAIAYFECDRVADLREEIIAGMDLSSSRSGTQKPKSVAEESASPEEEQLLEKACMAALAKELKSEPNTFLVVELKPATPKFIVDNSVVHCPLMEERTELKYKLQALAEKPGFETVRRAVYASKHVVAMTNKGLKVTRSDCSYCMQPSNEDDKICSSCAKASVEAKSRAAADFLKSTQDVEFARDALEHVVACHVDGCSYRLCAGFKLLLNIYEEPSKPDADHLELFREAVNLHKTKCTKTKEECKVPGCEGKPKTSCVARRAAKPAPPSNNDPSTTGVGRATRKRAHDSSAPATSAKIVRRH